MPKRPPMAKLRTPRYGLRIRRQYEAVLAKSKATYKCPKCGAETLKRARLGVWKCKKCGFEFAGGAWEPRTSVSTTAEAGLARVTGR